MSKPKYIYKDLHEFNKLKRYYEAKLEATNNKGWQTRYKKKLAGLNKSLAARERILRGDDPLKTHRFKGTKESAKKAQETIKQRAREGIPSEASKIILEVRHQEKILYGKALTPKIKGRDINLSLSHQQIKQNIKNQGLPPEVAAAHAYNDDKDVYELLKSIILSGNVKDLKKISSEQLNRLLKKEDMAAKIKAYINREAFGGIKELFKEKLGLQDPDDDDSPNEYGDYERYKDLIEKYERKLLGREDDMLQRRFARNKRGLSKRDFSYWYSKKKK